MKHLLSRTAMGLALITGAYAAPVMAQDLVIYQNWSSPAEVAALNVLKEAAAADGINWIDITIPHNTGQNVTLLNMVAGGEPPNIFIENSAAVYRDLTAMGLGRPLTEALTENGAIEHFPSSVLDSVTIDGEVMKMPLGIHIDGMLYYNIAVAEAAGVDPAAWDSLEAMYADFQKISDSGYVPLAVGAQQWQIGYLTHALVAAVAGRNIYNSIYGDAPDAAALDTPEVREVFDWLRKFQQAADEGSVNRDWNMTTNSVITGQALMQIHGDWMKGEWVAAGKVAGTDFGCVEIPGALAVPVTVDAWGALGGQPEEIDAAEMRFAQIVTDPVVNAEFAAVKGATPVRTDAPTDALDVCSGHVLSILEDPARQVPNPHSKVDADWQNSIWEVAFNFWSDPSMTTDDAIAQLQDNFDTILN
jgi:glucose/mannose transport system substrate-binding protein